jgi:putative component of membrane protein insertase Oxa1/YidC/SpoIIIJ protein YidD
MSHLNKFLLFIIVGIRPLFGPSECRFSVTCTQFAADQLHNKTFFYAVWAIVKRVVSCNPFF